MKNLIHIKQEYLIMYMVICTLCSPLVQVAAQGSKDNRIDQLADKYEADIIKWRHHIHQNPELSNREFNTAKMIADHLRSLNFDQVITDISPTGVVGILKGGRPGKVVALRADMDALPVTELADVPFKSTVVDTDFPGGPVPVAHACGHDAHVAMLMGAASVLAEMRSEINGTVMFIFQPAEEGPPLGEPFGAEAMIKAGIYKDLKPEAVFGIHVTPFPVGWIGHAVGPQNGASEVITITINGKQTHGSSPFTGLDPMPVLASINDGFAQVYRQIDPNNPFTISIGSIKTVGRSNIIGDSIVAQGTVRALNDNVLADINNRLERIVVNAAEMHGLTARLKIDQHVPAVINKESDALKFAPTAERVVGKEKTFIAKPVMGYDDVSVLMNEAGGGIYFLLGVQNVKFNEEGSLVTDKPGMPGIVFNHNPAFYAMDEALKTGVRLEVYLVFDFLQ